MRRLRVVTDSVADVPPELAARYDITVVPVRVRLGAAVHRDGELGLDQLYDPSNPFPVTETPDSEEMRAAYLALAADGAEILSIHVGARLSETVALARRLRVELTGQADIEVIDTETASLAEGLLVLRAAMLAAGGADRRQALAVLAELVPRTNILFAVNDLQNLVRGGRLGRAQAALGSLMSLRPVFSIRDGGEAGVVHTSRGWDRALAYVRATVREHATYPRENLLGVVHSRLPAMAAELAEEFDRTLKPRDIVLTEVGAGMGVHVGPGAIGVTFVSDRGRV